MSNIFDQAAKHNRHAWNSFRRQRDEGLVKNRYDPAADILQGKSYLSPQMIELMGDVSGKKLLDMGCGDGAEMLEWSRLGAIVVGVDNSPRQLEAAQRNADKLGVSCRLILADLLKLPEDLLTGQFDVVFSSHVTAWISDKEKWFCNIFLALKPGGIFLLNGAHSSTGIGDEDDPRDSYFSEGPFIFKSDKKKESNDPTSWNPAGDNLTTIEWYHTLGSIITAVGQSGLRITHLLELPDSKDERLPGFYILRAVKEKL